MISRIGFYIFYIFAWIFALLPFRVLYIFSDILSFICYYFIPYRKKIVIQNLKNSFPEKNKDEINKIARKFYTHFFDFIFEFIKLIHLKPSAVLKRVKWTNMEVFDHYHDSGKHLLTVLGHYANWEWIASSVSLLAKQKILFVYRPLENKYFDRLIYNLRSKYNGYPIPSDKILKTLIQHKNDKVVTATGFLADQCPNWGDIQYWLNFLNQDTPVYMGFEKIARKLDMPVVYLKMKKVKRGYYEVTIEPLFDDPNSVSDHEITDTHMHQLEQLIQAEPQYWLWTHRRWKRQRNQQKEAGL